jgi:SAM-dependent methyltransferase
VKPLSKLCDAADWFDPEFDRIVRTELAEEPRLHRKQWEFAQIFRALQSVGVLNGTSRGLSMGGGMERLLYAVVRHTGHLTVTDLYEADSSWNEARLEDPDCAVKAAAPFPVDRDRLSARRMDMRELTFPSGSFDFCYSSCAIEHIGTYDDFVRHLEETRRVLKDDGVYVLTTEFHYGEEVIPAPHNYYFSAAFLEELVRASSFAVCGVVDGTLRPHVFNRPVPVNLGDLCADAADPVTDVLLNTSPHLQLLTSGLPFTSMCLVLRKAAPAASGRIVPMAGLAASREWMAAGVRRWKAFVESAALNLDPFGMMSDRRPSGGVPRSVVSDGNSTVFHTGYVWLGDVPRKVTVEVDARPAPGARATIELRVHRHPALDPDAVSCCRSVKLVFGRRQPLHASVSIVPDAKHSFAVLGKVTAGSCEVFDVAVRIAACPGAGST